MAARKSVPSKDFIAKLERLDPMDLKEADRSKFAEIIECYVANFASLYDLLQRVRY